MSKESTLKEVNDATIFIGPESDHSLLLSLTDSLTHWLSNSCLVNLIDVTLACEDANQKLEVFTVADVDTEDHVGNNSLQIWELTFGPNKTKILFSTRVGQDFEVEVQARF